MSRTAVVIGCGPGLYREAKIVSSSRHKYYQNNYNPSGQNGGNYAKNASARSKSEGVPPGDINLEGYPRATVLVNNSSSSQEELFHPMGKDDIMVTRSVMVSASDPRDSR